MREDVQQISLPDSYIDRATIAYGIRNVKNPAQCLNEVYRVLKPEGKIGILELSQPQHFILKYGHQIYIKMILPLLGKLITSNQAAYHYLPNSIQSFIPPSELKRIMLCSGFKNIQLFSLNGGIATIFIGSKVN